MPCPHSLSPLPPPHSPSLPHCQTAPRYGCRSMPTRGHSHRQKVAPPAIHTAQALRSNRKWLGANFRSHPQSHTVLPLSAGPDAKFDVFYGIFYLKVLIVVVFHLSVWSVRAGVKRMTVASGVMRRIRVFLTMVYS